MAILQLLESEKDKQSSLKSKSAKKKIENKKDSSFLEEVSEEIKEKVKIDKGEQSTNIESESKKETPVKLQKIENDPVKNKENKNEQNLD